MVSKSTPQPVAVYLKRSFKVTEKLQTQKNIWPNYQTKLICPSRSQGYSQNHMLVVAYSLERLVLKLSSFKVSLRIQDSKNKRNRVTFSSTNKCPAPDYQIFHKFCKHFLPSSVVLVYQDRQCLFL